MGWIEFGYWGMFVSAILAATLIPLGSETVFIGLLYKNFDPILLTLTAGSGNTIGGLITYYLGRFGKWEWLEKWFGITRHKIENRMQQAQRYGWLFAFLTWLPIVGDLLAAIIGYARISPLITTIWMFAGKTLRFALLSIIWVYSIKLWK